MKAETKTSVNGFAECRIVRKRVSSLKPSPENALIYRHVHDDPDIPRLADLIEKNGCDPLKVTLDNFIVSGHRRHAALQLNGQHFVRCLVMPVRRDSMTTEEYIQLLRQHNEQRNKTVAEQVREELVDIDPEEAHRHLLEQRDKSINAAEHNGIQTLVIEGTKKRYKISDDKAEHVKH